MTILIIKSDVNSVAQQAIEFWSTICDVEAEIYSEIAQGNVKTFFFKFFKLSFNFFSFKKVDNDVVIHNAARKIAPHLVPVLFECLTKQEENIYDDEWNPAKCASACLTLVTKTIADDIIPISIPFIGSCITHDNWRYREAATLSLGCILDGPTDTSKLEDILEKSLPFLIKHIKEDPCLLVQDTSAWTIGKICSHFPSLIEKYAFPVIDALMIGMNSQEPLIAVQACNVREFFIFFSFIQKNELNFLNFFN